MFFGTPWSTYIFYNSIQHSLYLVALSHMSDVELPYSSPAILSAHRPLSKPLILWVLVLVVATFLRTRFNRLSDKCPREAIFHIWQEERKNRKTVKRQCLGNAGGCDWWVGESVDHLYSWHQADCRQCDPIYCIALFLATTDKNWFNSIHIKANIQGGFFNPPLLTSWTLCFLGGI